MTADQSNSTTTNTAPANLDDPSNARRWLQTLHPKQLALLDEFEISLRLGRFSSRGCDGTGDGGGVGGASVSSSSSKHRTYQYGRERRLITTRTVELLRAIIGPTRWKTAAQLLTLLRGLGNELHAAGGYREPAIGNMVRRIMFAVRDEADRVAVINAPSMPSAADDCNASDMEKIDELTEQISTKLHVMPGDTASSSAVSAGRSQGQLSLASMLWANPQHVTMRHSRQQSGDLNDRLRSDSFGSTDSSLNIAPSKDDHHAIPLYPPHYYNRRDDLRQSVMEAIQEMMSELEDLHKNINDQAIQHIHAGEIILTYALSKTVELVSFLLWFFLQLFTDLSQLTSHQQFLKAAAAKKRKFQVIVCEGSPHFGGHAMAKSLAEAGIDTTVIHDAATFAIMARVNKVLLPAHAVLVSGWVW